MDIRSSTRVILAALCLAVLLALLVVPKFALELILPDQTKYADGFTNDKWARIRIGDSENQVLGSLGHPLEITEYGKEGIYRTRLFQGNFQYRECYSNNLPPSKYHPERVQYMWYSFSRPGKWVDSYYVRSLKMDQAGRVIEKQSKYYHD